MSVTQPVNPSGTIILSGKGCGCRRDSGNCHIGNAIDTFGDGPCGHEDGALGVDQCLRSQMTKGEQGVIQPDWQSNRQNGTQLACDDAKEQLINTDRSVSEIAMLTGFSNADYLSSSFHRHEGMTPTVFRKGIRSDDRRTIKNAINR